MSLAAMLAAGRPAHAESVQTRIQDDLGELMRVLADWASQAGQKSRRELLSFVNKIELFNIESEIDRLVGNPWELSDSTSYKLKLAPLHVAFPVFDQQVRQMTRLDDIRSRRIQDLTVDSLGLIVVDLDILARTQTGGQLASSILRYFNAREYLDLGVFFLAQQPYFPRTPEDWEAQKHQLASRKGMLAAGVLGLGALFEVGALSNSGTLKRCPGNACSLGWYGGFSRLGYRLQPTLRGGLTARLPRLEVSAGLMEQVRPASTTASRVFEAAARESWLGRYTGVAGWDSFFEAAVRRVLVAEGGYRNESLTARGGLFVKRERPLRLRHITLRSSIEVESDLAGSLRYAFGLGVDYTKTGLSAVLQSSRTNVARDGVLGPETRTGLFVAGTVESPTEYYVKAMQMQARLLREAWNHFIASDGERRQREAELRVLASEATGAGRLAPVVEALRQASAESEAHRARVATLLGDYLEARRMVYSLKQWQRGPDELHGPLGGEVLTDAAQALFARVTELVLFLRGAQENLGRLRERYTRTVDSATRLSPPGPPDPKAADELAQIDRAWRQSSESATQALRLYGHYLGSIRRIAGLAGGLLPVRHLEPLDQRTLRKLLTLVAQPLY